MWLSHTCAQLLESASLLPKDEFISGVHRAVYAVNAPTGAMSVQHLQRLQQTRVFLQYVAL